MDDIRLIVIKFKKLFFTNEKADSIDLDLRIFCIREKALIEDIELMWGFSQDEIIRPLQKKNSEIEPFIQRLDLINKQTPGRVKKTVLMPKNATHFVLHYLSNGIKKIITTPITEKYDLLPSNASDFERVLALVTTRLSDLTKHIISPYDIANTPKQTLPWLAWLFSADDWSPNLETKIQRNLIANSIKIHRTKGSKASIKNAVKQIGGSIEIKEWWENKTAITSASDSYSFKIFININNPKPSVFEKNYYRKIKNKVDAMKPVTTKYSLALKANAACQASVVLIGYTLTRLSLHMELKA